MAKRKKSVSVRVSIRLPDQAAQILGMMEKHTGWSQAKCIAWALASGSMLISPDAKQGTELARAYVGACKLKEAQDKAAAIVADARAKIRKGRVRSIKFRNGTGPAGVLAAEFGAAEIRPGD